MSPRAAGQDRDRAGRLPDGLLVAWLGDDFTGSAAVMEVLGFAGLPAALFLDVPTPAQRARFPGLRALGIASTLRAETPAAMAERVPPLLVWLAAQRAALTHYKICSTLDSAPGLGSVGQVIDLAAARFPGWVPCLVAAPPIRRYQAFGTLFAAAPGGVYRLDRHPVMARHPATPMDEADVARHLGRQTARRFGLVDLEALQGDADARLAAERARGAEVICLDTASPGDLARAGQLIWEHRDEIGLTVGSQGVEYALVAHWRQAGLLPERTEPTGAGPVSRLIVVSGSVSEVTAGQIDRAEAEGFAPVRLDVAGALGGDAATEDAACRQALAALEAGRDPIVFTARGPDDPAVAAHRTAAAGLPAGVAAERLGAALGRVLARLLERTGLRRAVIAGGDTSGHACRQLDIFAFTALAPTVPGAALMVAHSETPAHHGIELALKGGQMGSPDFLGWIKRGGGAAGKELT